MTTCINIVGDPAAMAAAIMALIASGKKIYGINKSKSNADMLVIYGV